MNLTLDLFSSEAYRLPPVPESTVDRAKRVVDTSSDIWKLDDDHRYVCLRWKKLELGESLFLASIQHYLFKLIGGNSPQYLRNIFGTFKYCLSITDQRIWPSGQDADPDAFEQQLWDWLREVVRALRAKSSLHRFWNVRTWLIYAADNWPELGFSAELCMAYAGLELPQNPTGLNVHSDDPDVGPLWPDELHALKMALLKDACREHRSVQERAAVRLCLGFGRNPRNYCLLLQSYLSNKLKRRLPEDEGWILKIPRIKKAATKHGRHKLKEVYCGKNIVASVLELVKSNRELKVNRVDPPLFISENARRDGSLTELCMDSHEFSDLLHSFVKRMGVPSRVNDKLLHLTPRRLRYTFATTLARSGISKQALADALDHSNTKCVHVYFAMGKDMLPQIDAAFESNGGQLVSWFSEPIWPGEETNVNVPGMRIRVAGADESTEDDGGACAREVGSSCGLDVPLACYGCHKFQPFWNGPHEQALRQVEDRIDGIREFKNAEAELSALKHRVESLIKRCAGKKK
ncbi:site-specific integrase [Paraburkholderia unamae]|uniref:Phage integrase family protein n=1 Tax=Paraburkholderia unamae TaxID=219649 RepID=A0ABX5KKS2_9BURK|nr:site-specific integrase [Paraburkholderia unamae]PVX82461.1 phage integrase family protein [Paraburkholderia unamae]